MVERFCNYVILVLAFFIVQDISVKADQPEQVPGQWALNSGGDHVSMGIVIDETDGEFGFLTANCDPLGRFANVSIEVDPKFFINYISGKKYFHFRSAIGGKNSEFQVESIEVNELSSFGWNPTARLSRSIVEEWTRPSSLLIAIGTAVGGPFRASHIYQMPDRKRVGVIKSFIKACFKDNG